MTPPVTVIAVGNPYRRDDGAGAAVLARLAPLVDPTQVRLADLDGEPVRLLQAWEGSRAVWIVDAVKSGRPAGTLHEVPADRLGEVDDRGVRLGGGHLMGLSEAFELARALDLLPDDLRVVGIEAADTGDGFGLSPAVDAACDTLAARLADDIAATLAAWRTGC